MIAKLNFWTDGVLMLSLDWTGMQIKTKITQLTLPNCVELNQYKQQYCRFSCRKQQQKMFRNVKSPCSRFSVSQNFCSSLKYLSSMKTLLVPIVEAAIEVGFGNQQPPLLVALLQPPDLLHHNHGWPPCFHHQLISISAPHHWYVSLLHLSHWIQYVTY